MKKILNILISFIFLLVFSIDTSFAFSLKDTTLNFAQVSDTHISDRSNTSYKLLSQSKDLLKDAIKQINNEETLDFVMFTGDMVDRPFKNSYKDFFGILYDLNYPVLMTLGNHDAAFSNANEPEMMSEGDVIKLISDCNPNQKYDKLYWAKTLRHNFHIIVLNLRPENLSSNGVITKEQLEFLDKELEENQDKVILIFEHHPLVEPFQSDTHKIVNSDEYFAVINKYKNPIAIFSGHYHTTKITRVENVIHISTPALVTYPNAFRIVKITNYKDRTIFDFYFRETNLKEAQAESKANTIAAATFEGTEKDRNTTIVIKKK